MKNNQLKIKFESSDDELNIPNNNNNNNNNNNSNKNNNNSKHHQEHRNNNHGSSKIKTSSHYYLNLRKLNSNRIEKQNMSKKTFKTYSDNNNFANFLDYFNLTISKQENIRINNKAHKNNLKIEKNLLHDSIKLDEESEFLNSKIDLIINNNKNNNQSKSNEIINLKNLKIDLNKTKQTKSNDSIQDYITKLNCLPVPIESFQHIQTYLKHTISQSNSNQHQHKYELIYGKNFYWIVKIKKFYSNLYQLKLVRSCQETHLNNSNSSTSSNNQAELNQSLNESLNENINLNWFFSLSKNSYLSCLLLKHLKPIGWSKQNARQAKKPELSLTETCDLNELFEKLDLINNDENLNDQVDIDLESVDLVINNNKNIVKEYYDVLDINGQVFHGKCLSNKSGRLLIELIDLNRHISLFYTDSRLRSFGYFKNKIGFEYKNSIDSAKTNILNDLNESNSDDKLIVSQFKKNFLLECLYDNKFYVAVVIDVCEKEYFNIRIDSNDENNNHLLTYFYFTNENNLTNFHQLFPCKWSQTNNIRVELPNSWPSDKEFDWDEYMTKKNEAMSSSNSNELFTLTRLNETNTLFNWSRSLDTLKDKFKLGSCLECVLPSHNGLICLAKIEAKLSHLLFLKFFYKNYTHKLFVFTMDSTDIYPLGWAELNNYDMFNKDEFLNQNNNNNNNNCICLNNVVRSNLSLNNSSLSYFKSKI